jgi:hypothetical protein
MTADLDSPSPAAELVITFLPDRGQLGRVSTHRTVEASHGRPAVRLAAPAVRLAAAAVRLLPATDRARYGEEFRNELRELAAAGAGRRQQIGYALRQFRCAVPLRLAVRVPRRRKASP